MDRDSRLRNSMQSFNRVAVVVLVSTLGALCCVADEPVDGEEQNEAGKEGIQKIVASLDNVKVTAGDDEVPLDFQKTPILRWPNIRRGTQFGGTFIWTRDGRPEVIACIWDWEEAGMWFGIQSFSASKVVAKKGGGTFWRSDRPDLEFKKFDGVAPPADSPIKRLSQMKELAGRFRARVHNGGKNTEELRLLTTPVYRYKSGNIVDGSLFAFVEGTDPEVMLHFEARRLSTGKSQETQWHYAISRRSSFGVEAMLDDKNIWSVEETRGGPTAPFFVGPFPGR